jgi:hypothetical protein
LKFTWSEQVDRTAGWAMTHTYSPQSKEFGWSGGTAARWSDQVGPLLEVVATTSAGQHKASCIGRRAESCGFAGRGRRVPSEGS